MLTVFAFMDGFRSILNETFLVHFAAVADHGQEETLLRSRERLTAARRRVKIGVKTRFLSFGRLSLEYDTIPIHASDSS
jgi:hypothetical protein